MDSIYFFIFLFIVVIILLNIRMYLTRLLNKYGSFFVYYAPKWFKNNSSVLFNLLRWLNNDYIYSILIYLFYFMLSPIYFKLHLIIKQISSTKHTESVIFPEKSFKIIFQA